jgi:hypothetical protein
MADESPNDTAERTKTTSFWAELKRRKVMRVAKKQGYLINYHALKNSLSFYPLRDHPGFQELLADPALKLPIPIE